MSQAFDDIVVGGGSAGCVAATPLVMAVLDRQLRVRGIDGMRVIDRAAMPLIPSGNTSTPAMALADRAVALIGQEPGAATRPTMQTVAADSNRAVAA